MLESKTILTNGESMSLSGSCIQNATERTARPSNPGLPDGSHERDDVNETFRHLRNIA